MKNIAAVLILAIGQAYAEDKMSKPYISGEVHSKETFQYGRFVTRMQGSNMKGTLASFLTLWLGDDEEEFSIEGWNHINLEIVPSQHHVVNTNLIYSGFTNDWEPVYDFNPLNDWHTYAIEWTPDYIAFSVDENEVRREHASESEAVQDLDKEQHLFLSFWTPLREEAASGLDDSNMPYYTRYDYVEAYDYVESTDEFVLRFRDDFEHLDSERWSLGNHTFADTSTTFVPDNAYVSDGNLVLKMEKSPHQHPEEPEKPEPILPEPLPGTLDKAILDTTRVLVTMVRTQLESFSQGMAAHLQ